MKEHAELEEIVEEVEKQRSSDGQARRAGVGETDGEGEEPRMKVGDGIEESSSQCVEVVSSKAMMKSGKG